MSENTSKKKQPLASRLVVGAKNGEALKIVQDPDRNKEQEEEQEETAANWKSKLEEIKKVFYLRKFDLAENQATALIEQIDTYNNAKKSKQGEQGILADWMIKLYYYRNFSRMELGNFHGAIADATKALGIFHLYKRLHEGDYTRTDNVEMDLLLDRGWSHLQLRDDLDAAYTDFKACRAVIIKGDECKLQPTTASSCHGGQEGTLQDVTAKLSIVMALQKAKSESSRPHYTPKEQESVEQEFGFGIYAKEKHRCLGCGETKKSLLLCSRCRGSWFCGKACQKKTWKIHKGQCNKRTVYLLSDEEKQEFDKRIKRDGYFHLPDHADDTRVTIVLYDKTMGRYFDSLTDAEVLFVPSGSHRFMEGGCKDGIAQVRCRVNVTGTMSDDSAGRFMAAMKKLSPAHNPLRVVPNNTTSHELKKGGNPK
jgi:hypothetical protein